MGKLVVVVGNSGIGKTALTQALRQAGGFTAGLEGHATRPFQQLFHDDLQRYALANQLDFLLLRAEQEFAIRQHKQNGIQDGGLDMDFFVFTHLFFQRGYLSKSEYDLCQRLHTHLRNLLPPPEVIIHMMAPIELISARFAQRARPLEIAALDDLEAIDGLLRDWLVTVEPGRVITLEASTDDPQYSRSMPTLLNQIQSLLNIEEKQC